MGDLKREANTIQRYLAEYIEAQAFAIESAKDMKHKKTMRDRGRMMALATVMSNGGFGKELAKILGRVIFDFKNNTEVTDGGVSGHDVPSPAKGGQSVGRMSSLATVSNMEEFDHNQFHTFSDQSGITADKFNKLHCQEDLQRKRAALAKDMLVTNPNRNASLTTLQHQEFDVSEMGFTDTFGDLVKKEGASSWIKVMKAGVWRWGPAQENVPGFGQLVMSSSPHCWALSIRVAAVGELGVALSEVNMFLQTTNGKELLKNPEDCKIMPLPEKSVVWIPFGWAMCSFFLPPKDAVVKPQGSTEDGTGGDLATVISHVVWEPTWASSLDKKDFQTVCNWIGPVIKSKAGPGSHMWCARLRMFEALSKACGKPQ